MKRIVLILAALVAATNAFSWGKLGHDAIVYIAEQNLTPKAKREVAKIFNDTSMVYFSVWMDEYRATPTYKHTTTWHSFNVDKDNELIYNAVPKGRESYRGDAVYELNKILDKMKDYKHMDDSTASVNLKMIIHMVADIHCPTHVLYEGLKGYKVTHMGKYVSYHSVFDSGVLANTHEWNFTEYNHVLGTLSRKQAKEISKGTIDDWARETADRSQVIYTWAQPDDQIGKNFNLQARPLVHSQVQKAAYRLAKTLNELFK